MTSRIYLVSDSQHNTDYLVRASNAPQAKAFIARNLSAEVATQDQLIQMVTAGAKVLDATDRTEAQPLTKE